ncbi:MAG: phage tail tape measure protein [Bosea sp. (in: a-proteobacteria)]
MATRIRSKTSRSKDLPPIAEMGNLMKELRKSSEDFGRSITGAFAKGVADGKRFEDVLKNIGKAMVENLLKAALKPVELSLSSLADDAFSKLFSTLQPFPDRSQTSAPAFAQGAAFSGGRVRPFAAGGVIAAPTYFPMAGGSLGLMGERGAEAIMPLSRGADGKLGVRSEGGQRASPIIVQVSTPDADSFRRSESQVAAAIARAAARGRRAI